MGSIVREIRLRQKEKATKELDERKSVLEASGVTGNELERDPILKRARAKVRQVNRQLKAIDARAQHVEKVAAEKKAKASTPKEQKSSANKKAKQQPDSKKKKAKK